MSERNDVPACRWSHHYDARIIPGRHDDACKGAGPGWHPPLVWAECDACLECVEDHCRSCGHAHAEQVCPRCIARVREKLEKIEDLCLRLPDEAINNGARNSAPGRNVMGGDPMVLLAGGSDGKARAWARERGDRREALGYARGTDGDVTHALDEREGDPVPPIVPLLGWEETYRKAFDQPADEDAPPTIGGAIAYLEDHLHVIAAYDGDLFCDLGDELDELIARLENVLTDGTRPQKGAPCVQCSKPLERIEHRRNNSRDPKHPVWVGLGIPERRPAGFIGPMPERMELQQARPGHEREGAQDFYRCNPCSLTVSVEQYRYAVGVAHRAHADRLTASDLMLQYGVKRGSLTGWASLGKVRRRGKSEDGRTLYDVADVLRMMRGGEEAAS